MTVNTRTRAITALALTGALLGGGALTAAPASAAPIPPGCTIRATSTAAHTKCLDMAHRAAVKCTGDNWHFGDRTLSRDTVGWPGGADEAKQRLRLAFRTWNQHMHELGDDGFAAPVGGAEATQWGDLPMVALVLHLQRELIHHGAEIALLRDLYRART